MKKARAQIQQLRDELMQLKAKDEEFVASLIAMAGWV